MSKLRWYYLIARGKERMLFGFCPRCNSDAPLLYECPVCVWTQSPKNEWWSRFIQFHKGELKYFNMAGIVPKFYSQDEARSLHIKINTILSQLQAAGTTGEYPYAEHLLSLLYNDLIDKHVELKKKNFVYKKANQTFRQQLLRIDEKYQDEKRAEEDRRDGPAKVLGPVEKKEQTDKAEHDPNKKVG